MKQLVKQIVEGEKWKTVVGKLGKEKKRATCERWKSRREAEEPIWQRERQVMGRVK